MFRSEVSVISRCYSLRNTAVTRSYMRLISSGRTFLWMILTAVGSVTGALAQDHAFPVESSSPPPPAASGGVRILSINSTDLSPLRNLASSNVQAVSLDVPLQVVLSDPASVQSL